MSPPRGIGRCSHGQEECEPVTQFLPNSRASHPLSLAILPTHFLSHFKRCVISEKKGRVFPNATEQNYTAIKRWPCDLLWPRQLILLLLARNWNRRRWSATTACDHWAGYGVRVSTEDGASRTLVITFCGNPSFLCSTGSGPAV